MDAARHGWENWKDFIHSNERICSYGWCTTIASTAQILSAIAGILSMLIALCVCRKDNKSGHFEFGYTVGLAVHNWLDWVVIVFQPAASFHPVENERQLNQWSAVSRHCFVQWLTMQNSCVCTAQCSLPWQWHEPHTLSIVIGHD